MTSQATKLLATAVLCAAVVLAPPALAGAAGDAPTIDVPALPGVPTRTIVVDTADIARRAAAAPRPAPGTDPGEASASFFYGDLAMSSFQDICTATPPELAVLLGNIQVSGYFGGVWFRDQVPGLRPQRNPLTPLLTAVSRGTTRSVDTGAGQLLRLREGTAAQVRAANARLVDPLLFIHGYNRGYLEVVAARPPAGVVLPPGYVTFEELLLTRSARFRLGLRADLAPALERLRGRATPEWAALDRRVKRVGGGSVEVGRATWKAILRGGPLQGATYRSVLDLSTGFLQVTEAAALASMAASADGDPGWGRCSLALQAGLVVWAGSYFAGLASELPPGSYPTIVWP